MRTSEQIAAGCLCLLLGATGLTQPPAASVSEYVRSTPKGLVKECTFTLHSDHNGWSVVSVTQRGTTELRLTSRHDSQNRLQEATVTLSDGARKTATAQVKNGQARVQRPGQPAQEFDAPPGVIVTSAPDWTDIWLLCRRYDRKQGGEQTFPGLWIHPTQPAQAIPFRIERQGSAVVNHAGNKLKLDRFTIRIRGPNPYVAWANEKGELIKLAPLPYREGSTIVRREFAEAARDLRPVP